MNKAEIKTDCKTARDTDAPANIEVFQIVGCARGKQVVFCGSFDECQREIEALALVSVSWLRIS